MPSAEISERWVRLARDPGDPLSWPGEAEFGLLHGEGSWVVFGEDPICLLEDLKLPRLRITRDGELPPILPDFLGFASYEAGYGLDASLPAAREFPWAFPKVRFAMHQRVRILHQATGECWECQRDGLASLGLTRDQNPGLFKATKVWDSDDGAAYARKVQTVRQAIHCGEVYQANLCRQEAWAWTGDLLQLAHRLRGTNPAPFSALLAGQGWAVLSTSPERFLRIEKGRIESCPIKGTAPRGRTPEEDAALAAGLQASAKDRAELTMIVDLVRNDLARVCELPSVRVEAFPELQSHPNVHHLVATVSGRARAGLSLGGLFTALFPAGSISGCPKLAAMALLRSLEEHPRLASTGALGWFRHDLCQLDLAVAIRTLSIGPGELRLGLGGGITWDSDPEAEYLETVHKGRSLLQCLS
jgi:para-aminobenzoate synthetase component 1